MQQFIKIHPDDNVAVALKALPAGSAFRLGDRDITLKQDIPSGHKFALCDIMEGEDVIKYGASIGKATAFVCQGGWVHIHNMKTGLEESIAYTWEQHPAPKLIAGEKYYFQGYRRSDGRVGIRNEIWIIPTVGCVNSVAEAIEQKAQEFLCESLDAVVAFRHPYGCSQMGEDQENTRKILSDLIRHPNAGGVLVLGLGCENSGIDVLKKYVGAYDPQRVKFLVAQEWEDEVEQGLLLVKDLAERASGAVREPIPCSELIVGLKCGGSDGLSGITANPVVGALSDLLISQGGSTVLTEVPEMFGAEVFLMNRCGTRELFDRTAALINGFKDFFTAHGQTVYENPSPGNKEGESPLWKTSLLSAYRNLVLLS